MRSQPVRGPLTWVCVLSFVACSGGGARPVGDGGAGADVLAIAPVDGGPGVLGMVPGGDSGPSATSLAVDPPSATLTVTDPTTLPTVALTARATYADGSTQAVSASWTVDRLDIATIGAGNGAVSAAGNAFGAATVTATVGGLTATAMVHVSLQAAVAAAPVAGADRAALAAATRADPSVTAFAYPYDGTVFPSGLLPPEMMWNGGAAGDEYLVHVVAPSFDLSFFTSADPPSRAALDPVWWNALATTAAGGSAQVTLARLSSGAAYASARETWTFARANLHGVIDYWSIADGQIIKLDLTTGLRTPLFDSGSALDLGSPPPLDAGGPASPPWEDALPDHERCVACHSVSRDGQTVAAVFSRGDSTGPFGYVGVAQQAPRAIGDYSANGAFAALTPDGRIAAVNDNAMTVALADTSTGLLLPSALDGLSSLCDPVFSPDGTKLALATRCGQGDPLAYPVQYTTSDLSVFDLSGGAAPAVPTLSNLRTVTAGGAGDAFAYPSFSPDSQWLVVQRGDNARAKINFMQPYTHGHDDLYVVRADASATPIALDRANGAGQLSSDNLHLNYAPTVNPIAEGGYLWVVFTSPRDYGNRTGDGRVAGSSDYPSDPTYANPKQLWVAAVDANVGAVDPSHPAFWLPGQDVTTINMFGYWALAPCKATADDAASSACTAGFECCSGFCRGGVCASPPAGCHELGEVCGSSGDCCGGGACLAGVCQAQAPR